MRIPSGARPEAPVELRSTRSKSPASEQWLHETASPVYTFQPCATDWIFLRSHLVKRFLQRIVVCFLFVSSALSQSTGTGKQPLTIEAIFAEGGITGRTPETVEWSPDSAKVSFVQRDDSGEH